jgi:hypothetical protein
VTLLDVGALVVIALTAFTGFRRGLVVGVCSLAGLAGGAWAGATVAPHILSGETSVYPPLVALGGVVLGAALGQMLAITLGRSVRQLLRVGVLRAFDNVTGAMLGAGMGVALVWSLAAVLLYTPGDDNLRRAVQRSQIAGGLTSAFPPSDVIGVLARIDPFGALVGPEADVDPADPSILRDPDVRLAGRSVLRVTGHACGLGIEGTGWIAAPGYVVTNAHVVAGVRAPYVDRTVGRQLRGSVVAFDSHDDLAVIRVPGLRGKALPRRKPSTGTPIAILGYPNDGPFHGEAGRLGRTQSTFVRDAYGHFPITRPVTPLRGDIRPGNSGGPAVDGAGRVRAIVFARRAGSEGGFAIPAQLVAKLLREARQGEALATDCAES